MRILILVCVILNSISCFGQEVKHTIGLIPVSGCYNKGYFYSQGINYQIDFNRNSILASTEGTLFINLDANRSRNPNYKLIPALNESRLVYGRELINRNKVQHISQLKARIGYHYSQFSSRPNKDYWHIDSIPNNGVKGISGFQTHSASFGIHWSTTRFKKDDLNKENPKVRISLELDYILGLEIRLKGYNEYDGYQEKTLIKNTYAMHRNGIRFSFQYAHFVSNRVNLFMQYDILSSPYIHYRANPKIDILRGGKVVYPLFPSFKIGLQFCF